jgi:hypothetical protein
MKQAVTGRSANQMPPSIATYQSDQELREPLLNSPSSRSSESTDWSAIANKGKAETTWRMKSALWLDGSVFAHRWDCFDAFINVVFAGIYVTMTYYSVGPREGNLPPPPPQVWQTIDCILGILLLLQFIPRIYLSTDPYSKLTCGLSICTLLCTFAVIWVNLVPLYVENTFLEAGWVIFLYPFRFWRLLYSLESVIGEGKSRFIRINDITQRAIRLGLSIFCTLIVVTAWGTVLLT